MLDRTKFGTLTGWNRVWAVAAIHGEAERLRGLHHQIARRFQPRDRLVYLGNYLGYGSDIVATLDELITYRREVLAAPGMMPQDIVFLRGAQEEMWQKLLQLQGERRAAHLQQAEERRTERQRGRLQRLEKLLDLSSSQKSKIGELLEAANRVAETKVRTLLRVIA